jgi:hypothetical protein
MDDRDGKHTAAWRQVRSDARATRRGHPVDSGRTTKLPARKYEKTTEQRRAPGFCGGRSIVRRVPQARERSRLDAERVAAPAERHRDLNLLTGRAPKGEQTVALDAELVLSAAEGARGGVARLDVPVFRRCPACGGTGGEWMVPLLHLRRPRCGRGRGAPPGLDPTPGAGRRRDRGAAAAGRNPQPARAAAAARRSSTLAPRLHVEALLSRDAAELVEERAA